MNKFLLISLGLFVYLSASFFYSCGCPDCYEEELIIRADTLHKQIKVERSGTYLVQIGAFLNRNNADKFSSNADKILNLNTQVKGFPDGLYRVVVGEFTNIKKAEEMLSFVKSNGFSDSIIRDDVGPIKND
jgi:cell division protein FtsN